MARDKFPAVLIVFSLLLWSPAGSALEAEDLLPPEQAFRLTAKADGAAAVLGWDIADGYYLYRQKFRFVAKTPGAELGEPVFPPGETKHDEFFGDMEIYRKRVELRLPVVRTESVGPLKLEVTSQGCADVGVCYPPYKQTVSLDWPTPAAAGAAPPVVLDAALRALTGKTAGQQDLLPPDEAFRFHAEVRGANALWVSWRIADGYYLYREKFKFALQDAPSGIVLGEVAMPRGEPRHDEEFGQVEVFHGDVGFALPLSRADGRPAEVRLQADFQGCAERGVCYPPMRKTVGLALPAGTADASAGSVAAAAVSAPEAGMPIAEQDRIAAALKSDSTLGTALSFLGMGLLLAFTPCVFPMIPILSGIIVGHGHAMTPFRAFLLSLCYVLASALTYTVFGVLAGLFGGNLQALFQEPAVIIAFSLLFTLLAMSMFGLFTLQMPGFVQSRLMAVSNRQHGGTLLGVAVMGVLSALIVGPCVAAPLAGALIYIGQTGDAVLGGLALFAMGLGMGLPLIAIGASAGKLLPRAGIWMNTVKAAFGVGLLAVAVWLLERILPAAVAMFLWALLLIIPAIYLGALDGLPHPATGWRKLWKGVGIVMLTYGVLLLIGAASNSTDPLQPLRGIYAAEGRAEPRAPVFRRIGSTDELDQEIAAAAAAGRWVMLDYYADWCVSCKEMERYTFADPKVRSALGQLVLLQADVTRNSPEDQALLRRYDLIGPPATLFFGPDRQERKAFRLVGYINAEGFLEHLQKVIR